MPKTSYSLTQRVLHWSMALLIFFNLLFPDGMNRWHHLHRSGQPISPDDIAGANIHAYIGILILMLAALRLIVRALSGAPTEAEGSPAVLHLVARATHAALYLLLFAMPLSGIAAYYFGIDSLGSLHGGPVKMLLWVLISLHVLGAFAQHFYWRTNALRRMTIG